ncbi:polymeric immunoglobulin receptor-like [Parambassis ranga]|uniref:polymeric immunoglobulin receptor-like n=1 Tax=Parambassis ranga TaxID=210632 RepID=UPI001041CEAE|nr:polymeric immunoglobulin receptor-like [Parambassis ranga]
MTPFSWFFFTAALSCVTDAAVIHVSGYEGSDVHVSCSYDQGYEFYEKYLCRNDCGDSDVLITTSETKKNKYSIYDDKRTRKFTVTISDLQHKDAGKYWCGVTRAGKDIYTEVSVSVVADSCCDSVTKIQSYDGGSVSISCPYESVDQNNLKYICRGNQPSTCLQQAVVTPDSKQTTQFTLTDDRKSQFTVTISNLTQKDSGSYLCGVHRNTGLDVFSAVELEVTEWCCVRSSTANGFVGHPVTLQCPYPPQHHDNRKFLCKGDHRSTCTDMPRSQSRYTLQEDASSSSFSVTITELEAGDAGTYWCGSDSQWSVANYTKIHLSVVFPQHTSTVIPSISVEITVTQTHGKPFKDGVWLYVAAGVPAVLLILIVISMVTVCKYKCYRVQEPEVTSGRSGPSGAHCAADVYANKEAIMYSKQRTGQESACDHTDADEDQPDYENFTVTEEIYCNQNFHKANNV